MWESLVDWLDYTGLGLPRDRLGGALNFFIYDTGKIFLLLLVIIFAISVLRSFFPVEKTKRIIAKLPPFIGNILAALLGIVHPSVRARQCRSSSALYGPASLWG